MFVFFPLVFISLITTGCSIYQSDGRKFLEKGAYEFAGATALPYLSLCAHNPTGSQSWIILHETPAAKVLAAESEDFQMRVVPKLDTSKFYCDFSFSSAQEMYAKASAAVDLTILHFGLGEFAFRPLSPLK